MCEVLRWNTIKDTCQSWPMHCRDKRPFCWRYRMICFMSSLIKQFIILQQTSIVCCCNCWALTLRTVCLNIQWAISNWHLWLKHLNCWWKAVKNLIDYSCIFNVQLHVHLKNWTLKFKLLYLRNYISYFNKICRICCVNIRIQSLKVRLKYVLQWLK